jgi:hypothetical protein
MLGQGKKRTKTVTLPGWPPFLPDFRREKPFPGRKS